MRRKVLSVIAAHLTLTALVVSQLQRAGTPIGPPAGIAALTVVFALVATYSVRLEFRSQQATFTLTEAVFVCSLVVLGPLGTCIAGAAGEAIVWSVRRLRPLKFAFNLSNQLSAMALAGAGFALWSPHTANEPSAWIAGLAAALCFSLFNLASLTIVLSFAEQRRFHEMFLQSALTGVLVTLASAPMGIIFLALYREAPIAPLLLAPIVVAVALNNRDAVAQRDEHLRFERLYEAVSRIARLVSFESAQSVVAGEARALLTGTAALCCAQDADGRWTGVLVDDDGARDTTPGVAAALAALQFGQPSQELEVLSLEPELRRALPRATEMVLGSSSEGSAAPVVLAVLRTLASGQDTPASRLETMAAFVTHAAMAIGNARLLDKVEVALHKQLDLNRQKDDFVAAVSHELRTPITSMLGAVDTIVRLDGRMNDDRRRELLQIAASQGSRLTRLIEELLVVAAVEHVTMACAAEVIDLHGLLVEVGDELHNATAGRVVIDIGVGAATIVSDTVKVRQIVMNLVENAGKYAPDGPIEVSTQLIGTDVTITVRDHGPGIPPDDREHAFERFVQLDQSSTRRNGGTGLGLHLCRQLAGALGGQLELVDTQVSGCAFVFRVPAGDATAIATTAAASRPARPSIQRRPDTFPRSAPKPTIANDRSVLT